MGNKKATIKYGVLLELLKSNLGNVIIEEALKEGEIEILDEHTGMPVGRITLNNLPEDNTR